MAEFFKTSTIWIVDFLYDGRARRSYKAFGPNDDVHRLVTGELHKLHGKRARLVDLRKATEEEELRYLHGDEPRNVICPTGR